MQGGSAKQFFRHGDDPGCAQPRVKLWARPGCLIMAGAHHKMHAEYRQQEQVRQVEQEKPTIFVLTASYPYSVAAERTFLEPEIERFVKKFSRVVIVPQDVSGQCSQVPAGAHVDVSLAKSLSRPARSSLLLRGLASLALYREIQKNAWLLLRPKTLLRTAIFLGRAKVIGQWVERTGISVERHGGGLLFYGFWLDVSALGLGMLRSRLHAPFGVVARAHGGDLYAERHTPRYIPFQEQTIDLLDWVSPDSMGGAEYLRRKYPQHAKKIWPALLGTDDPGFAATASDDGKVRVVSCAFLVEVKRIDLLVRGVAELSGRMPGTSIEWTHFGDGPIYAEIKELAEKILPPNVRWRLMGHVDTSTIYKWYRENPVDVFVNVSSSEGTPVSIMEAISCSIPVVATAVGGNKEIVSGENGALLSQHPEPIEIAEAIESVCLSPKNRLALREGSRAMWDAKYNAGKNYMDYANRLIELAAQLASKPSDSRSSRGV